MHTKIIIKCILMIVIIIFTSSCSLLSPVKTPPVKTYVLNALPQPITKKPKRRITLLVMQPQTISIYNTTQMAYTTRAFEVAYFTQNRWGGTPAQMLHPLIIQTLQATCYFFAVNSPTTASRYDYVLNTQLLELKQVFCGHSSDVHLTLRAQLVNAANNQVIKTKQFCVVQPAPQNTPYGGVIAANSATAIVLQQLAEFSLKAL